MSRKVLSRISISFLIMCFAYAPAYAQVFCPTNIGFENGVFSPWVCLSGLHSGGKKNALAVTTPLPTRHTITSGTALDYYGKFPIVDPVSGVYSAKIGNDSVNKQMEGIQYKFKVPTGLNNYSLVYRYAVVFEDPVHTASDQPYFEVRVTDSATGNQITCASFIYVSGSSLPGFAQSDSLGRFGNSVVYYKPWSTASLNLSGHGGKTLIVEFISADCALGAHMGYGYVDVGCGLFAISTATCNPTTPMTAPPGFMKYKWYSANYTLIDSGQNINVPTPTSLTTYHVILTPYPGYGCVDTLHTTIQGSILSVNAGKDTMMCNNTSVPLNATVSGNTPPYTYSWSPTTSLSCTTCANPIASPTATTNYVVTVTDSLGCVRRDTVKVIATPDLTITTSSTYCSPMGTATASVAYGTPPFSFVWNTTPPLTTQTITGLAAGTYAVTVTDAKGCIGKDTAYVVQAPAIKPTVALTTSSCGNSATIAVSATGGAPGYVYALDSGAYRASGSFDSLSAGTYTIHIKDSIGCVKDTVVVIPNTSGLSLSASVTNVSCNGGSNGTISVTGSGGKSPYQYKLGSGTFGTASTFTGLTAGTYSVSIKDSNNCINQLNAVVVSQSAAIAVSTAKTNIQCNGDSTGAVTITATGGNAGFTYSLNGSAYATTNAYTGLGAGVYPILVKDSLGCTQASSVTITQPAKLALSYTAVTPACNGALTASITISGSGGTTPYQYALGTGTYGTSGNFTNLAAGTYVLRIKDANNCTKDSTITITQPSALAVGAVAAQVNCFGNNTGSVTISGAGGTSPYTYALNTGSYSASNAFTGLTAGTYLFHTKDANGCIKDTTITITQPAPLALSVAATQPTCNGSANASITMSGSGGSAPYQYALNAGSYSTTSTFTGLAAGSYTLHIKDANNCQKDTTITIAQPTALTMGYTAPALLCNGNSTTISITAAGGTSPYQYSVNTGTFSSTTSYPGTVAGTYVLHIKDANNCTKDSTITIIQPVALTGIANVTNVLCNGGATGAASITAAGGTTPYTYALNAGTYGAAPSFSALTAGTYTLRIKDANNCTKDTTITITQPTALTVSASGTNPTCNPTPNGSASITGAGGVLPFQYSINGGAYGASGSFSSLAAGSHVLRVRDANNCVKDTTITLIQPNAPSVALAVTSILCNGNSTGAIAVTATGGTPVYAYALNAGTFGTTSSFTNLAAGTYTVKTRDLNNCQKDTTVTITQPTKLALGYTAIMPLCNGGSGSVTIAGSGGTTPYQYAVNAGSFANTASYSSLSAGSYVLHVKDANGCTKDSTITITQPTALGVSLAVTNVACNAGNNGAVSVTATGGTPAYTYAINTGTYGSSSTFSALTAGTYTVHVKDANGCIKDTTIAITQPAAMALSASGTNPTCNPTPNGTASISGSGGVAPYQYSINGGTYGSSGSFSGLAAGSHILRVRDANNCVIDTTVILVQPNAPAVALSVTNILCNGNATGAATVTATGGTPAYTYALNTGSFGSTSSFSSLAAGTYTIRTKDVNNCQKDTTFTITQPTVVNLGYVVAAPLCNGGTGSVTITGIGGTSPYQYSVNAAAFSGTALQSGLAVGTHVLHVKDANGCTKDSTITITQPTTLSISVTTVAVSCNGGTNGSATVTASGGTPGYTYAVNTGAFGSSNVLPGLSAGTHIIHLKDANGCTRDTTITISQPSALALSYTATQPLCNGALNGTLAVSGTGGTAPFQYALNTGAFGSNTSFTGVGAGTHVLHLKDANGCTKDSTIVVAQPSPPALSLAVAAVLCNGGSTGSVSVTATGGTPSFTYALGTGVYGTTSTFSGLTAGTHTIHIKDGNGCQKDSTITVTQPTTLNLGLTSSQPLCGGANGSISLSAAGGTAPYQYAIGSASFGSAANFAGLTAGTYVLHIRDANGCTKDSTYILTQPSSLIPAVTLTNILCYGANTGAAAVSVTGGTAPFTYAVNNGAFGASSTLSGLQAGSHVISIKDGNGCQKDTTITISQPSKLSLTYAATQPLCFGASNGAITIVAAGGITPYTFALSNNTYAASNAFTGLVAGTKTLRIKDANGCTLDSVVMLNQPTALNLGLAVSNLLCNGDTTGAAAITATGATPAYTYALNAGSYAATPSFSGVAAGTHTIHVKDANGCQKDTTFTLTQPAKLTMSYTSTQPVCNGANGSITISGTGGTSPFLYALNTASFQNTAQFTGLTAGVYVLHLKDANGCQKDSTISLTQPTSVVPSVSVANVLCYGASTGSITVATTGGTAPFTYAVNNGAFSTSSTLANLPAGTHIVHIKDANGCQKDTTVTLTQPAKLSLGYNATAPLCNAASNGSVALSGAGGVSPYTFAINSGSFAAATSFAGFTAGQYTLHIKDANGCTQDSLITISEPTGLVASVAISNVLCNGGTSGGVAITATGGTPAYMCALNAGTFGTSASFSGMSAGTHTIHIKDANGCQKDTTFTVTEPSALNLAYTATQPLCSNGSNASVTINGLGGTSPYQYAVNTGTYTSSSLQSGLSGGTYVLHVKDANGCAKDSTIVIVDPASIGVSVNISNVICHGGNTGAVAVTPAGGTPPYTYAVNSGTYGTANTLTGLTAGTHIVHIRDANGCQKDSTITIGQPGKLSLTYSSTMPLCYGAGNGSVTAAGVGGTAPYTYAVNNGAFSATTTFAGLSAGANTLHIKDANGCTFDSIINLAQPTPVTVAPVVSNVLCFGGNSGTITVTPSGGTPSYTYAINNGTFGASTSFTTLSAGTYTVHIKDANGCTRDSIVTVGQAPPLNLSYVATKPLCYGQSNGSIAVSGVGGTSPYQYAVNAGTFTSSSTFSGLAANTYVLHVKDNHGCAKDSTMILTQPTKVNAATTHTNVICHGASDGTAQVVGTGGTAPYTYSWSATSQTTANVTGLSAGAHIATVTDANGCFDTASFIITQPNPIVISFDTLIPLCVGSPTGAITASATGGVSPHSYSWNTVPAVTGATALQLVSGFYTVTLTDAVGCVRSSSVMLIDPAPVTVSFTTTPATCYGAKDGTAIALGGNAAGPFTYKWNTKPTHLTDTITGLAAGTYSVTVTSAAGCKGTDSVTITQPTKVVATALAQGTCPGQSEGSATVSAIGGFAPYKYTWGTTPAQTGTLATGLRRGTYGITVTDANGCIATTTVKVDSFAGPVVSAGPDQDVCLGRGVALVASGAQTYEWTNDPTLSCLTCASPIAAPSDSTTYYVTGTDANGCKATDSVRVEVIKKIPVFVDPKKTICQGESVQLGASGGTSWYWLPPVDAGVGARPTVSPTVTTTYTVVITQNQCFNDTLTQEVEVLPTPYVNLGPDIEANIGETITLNARVQNALDIAWTPEKELTCYNCYNPQYLVRGYAEYVAKVTNELGCAAYDTVIIRGICDEKYFFVANMFTPNGDGNNDRFYPQGAGETTIKRFMIYDRWGEVVFAAANISVNDPMAGWDGTFKGQPLKPDVYVYVMEGICANGNKVMKRGDVTLIR